MCHDISQLIPNSWLHRECDNVMDSCPGVSQLTFSDRMNRKNLEEGKHFADLAFKSPHVRRLFQAATCFCGRNILTSSSVIVRLPGDVLRIYCQIDIEYYRIKSLTCIIGVYFAIISEHIFPHIALLHYLLVTSGFAQGCSST